MGRRVWTGVLAGVLAASVLGGVALGAYRAGQDREVVTRVTGDGEVVRVIDGRGWGHGPGPGFFLIPLAVVLTVLLVRGHRGGPGGWHGPYGPAPWSHRGPDEAFHEWHRRAHDQTGPPEATVRSSGPPDA